MFHDHVQTLLPIALMRQRWHELALPVENEYLEYIWHEAAEEIKNSTCDKFVISSEWFAFEVFSDEQLGELKNYLAKFDVKIIMVLRNIVDFFNSVYAQRVRDGFMGTPLDYAILAWDSLNWKVIYDRWVKFFGEENIIALRFENMRQEGVIEHFIKNGLDSSLKLKTAATKNQSLPQKATELIFDVNASIDIPEKKKQKFADDMKDFFETFKIEEDTPNYIDENLARILSRNCVWPKLSGE